MNERVAQLVAYVQSHHLYPESVSIEYDKLDLLLPDVVMQSKRLAEYIVAQPVQLLPNQRFTGFLRYDNTLPADIFTRTGHKRFHEVCNAFYNQPVENLCTFEWQHSTADFSYVIHHGIQDYQVQLAEARKTHASDPERMAFLRGVDYILHGILARQDKCRVQCLAAAQNAQDEETRTRYLEMAEDFSQVPAKPARTFREAIQSLCFCFCFLPDCVGTMDRYLYPLYQQDIQEGRLTPEEAKAYIQELLVDVYAFTGFDGDRSDFSAESHFAIGGYLPNGEDGFNDLSRLILDALMEMPLNKPQITLRWTRKLAFEDFLYVLDCERHDALKRVAIVNDEPRIRSFMENVGLSYKDAVNYTMVGCNEPALQGGIWLGGATTNVARSMENTLKRRDDLLACQSFDAFYAIYEEELHKDLAQMLYYSDAFNRARAKDTNVLSSIFLDGCIANAKSATQGGARLAITGMELMGTTCVIDSLTVVKQFVFEEKVFTMEQLLDALAADWHGYDLMHRMIRKRGRFFGNNDPVSDALAQRFTRSLYAYASKVRNLFGNRVLYGCLAGYNPHYIWFGQSTAATPDGRRNGEPFMVGAGQSDGKDRSGLTSLLNSVAQMDPTGILCGPFLCNLMLDETLVRKDENFVKTAQMLEAYFKSGGLHLQLNYVSTEELLDAREHPEKYGNLRVRVSGFSGTFTLLEDEMQNEIIRRTVQK